MNELNAISPVLPVLIRILVTTFAAMLVLLLISVVVNWFVDFLSDRLARAADDLRTWRNWVFVAARAHFYTAGRPIERLLETHNPAFSLDDPNRDLRQRVQTIHNSLRDLTKKVRNLDRTFEIVEEQMVKRGQVLRQNVAALQTAELEGDQVIPPRRQALLKTITFSILGIVLVSVNTLMLSEFFKSLMPSMLVLGLPLYSIAACLFSLLEFGAGAILAFIDGTRTVDTARRLGLVIGIAVLGLIEFGFYAGFSENLGFSPLEGLVETGTTAAVLAKKWFGIFGPVIVFVMAWSAEMLFTGMRNLAADNISRALDRIRAVAERTGEALDTLKNTFGEPKSKDHCTKRMLDAQKALADEIEKAQTARLEAFCSIGRSGIVQVYYGNLFLFLVSLAGAAMIVLVYSQQHFATTLPDQTAVAAPGLLRIDNFTLPIIAAVEAFLLFGAGYLSTWGGRHNRPMQEGETTFTWPTWTTVSFLILTACCFVVGNAFLLFRHFTTLEYMSFCFVVLGGALLFLSGRHVGLVIPAVWALTAAVMVVILSAAMFSVAGLLTIVFVLVLLMKFLLETLARPFRWILERFTHNRIKAIT